MLIEMKKNKNIQSPTSRCRRSAARNFIPNLSIEPEKQNISDISTLIEKPFLNIIYFFVEILYFKSQ
jgi:hypothetical protein